MRYHTLYKDHCKLMVLLRKTIKIKRGMCGRFTKTKNFVTMIMNPPLKVILKEGLMMRSAPSGKGSTLKVAFLHPLKVFVAPWIISKEKYEITHTSY